MARLRHALQVARVKEKASVPTVRNPMVHDLGPYPLPYAVGTFAVRLARELNAAQRLPPA